MHYDVLMSELLRFHRQQGRIRTFSSQFARIEDTDVANDVCQVRMQDDGQLSYHQFDAVPHPPIKPMAYSGGFSGM